MYTVSVTVISSNVLHHSTAGNVMAGQTSWQSSDAVVLTGGFKMSGKIKKSRFLTYILLWMAVSRKTYVVSVDGRRDVVLFVVSVGAGERRAAL